MSSQLRSCVLWCVAVTVCYCLGHSNDGNYSVQAGQTLNPKHSLPLQKVITAKNALHNLFNTTWLFSFPISRPSREVYTPYIVYVFWCWRSKATTRLVSMGARQSWYYAGIHPRFIVLIPHRVWLIYVNIRIYFNWCNACVTSAFYRRRCFLVGASKENQTRLYI